MPHSTRSLKKSDPYPGPAHAASPARHDPASGLDQSSAAIKQQPMKQQPAATNTSTQGSDMGSESSINSNGSASVTVGSAFLQSLVLAPVDQAVSHSRMAQASLIAAAASPSTFSETSASAHGFQDHTQQNAPPSERTATPATPPPVSHLISALQRVSYPVINSAVHASSSPMIDSEAQAVAKVVTGPIKALMVPLDPVQSVPPSTSSIDLVGPRSRM